MNSPLACILTPKGFVRGRLNALPTGRLAPIEGTPLSEDQARDSGLPLCLPGFIDLHVHGGGGRDLMEGGDSAEVVARVHARHGTTAWLATTLTAPHADLRRALADLAPLCRAERPPGARILGVHLEGPYIHPERLGAQPPYARAAQWEELLELHALAPIALLTLAPDVGEHLALIPDLCERGMRVQIGHSPATYEQGCAALAAGATGFTHLFNAMSGLHHREPGLVGAALAHAQYAEIIPDLIHVHPGAIRTALRAIPKLYCVSDATASTGMPDGAYPLGRHTVHKCLGAVRLPDGTLAGSVLTLDIALRHLVERLGLSYTEASARLSLYAAEHMGWSERGRLQAGAWADAVWWSPQGQVQQVWVEGRPQDLCAA